MSTICARTFSCAPYEESATCGTLPGKKSTSSSRSSTYHSVTPDGDIKMETHEKNGKRWVSVEQNGKQLAKDLPWEEIETLPKGIQELLKKNAGKGSVDLRTPNNSLRLEIQQGLRVPGEKRGRADRKRREERKPSEKKKLDPEEKKRQIKV